MQIVNLSLHAVTILTFYLNGNFGLGVEAHRVQ